MRRLLGYKGLKSKRFFLSILTALLVACLAGATVSLLFKNERSGRAVDLPGSGTANDPYTISSADDLINFSNNVNGGVAKYIAKGIYVVLDADIDLASKVFTPIGGSATSNTVPTAFFSGYFNGQGHTISNMRINRAYAFKGLFGYARGATIENLTIDNPLFALDTGADAGGNYTGSIVGQLVMATNGYTGYIKNCKVTGGSILSKGTHVGGIVGSVTTPANVPNAFSIENCSVTGTAIKGGTHTGGMVGQFVDTASSKSATVTNCTVTDVTVNCGQYSGGLIGAVSKASIADGLNISDCSVTNTTVTSTSSYIGGIVGTLYSNTVTNAVKLDKCTVTGGKITGTGNVGGIVGHCSSSNGVGAIKAVEITNCAVKGIRQGTHTIPTIVKSTSGDSVGGIVGYSTGYKYGKEANGTEFAGNYITDCYSTATVTARQHYAGGIAGYFGGAYIDKCYSTGAVSTVVGTDAGGIAGYSVSTVSKISNCLVTGDVSSGSANTSGTRSAAGGIVAAVEVGDANNFTVIEHCIFTGNALAATQNSSGYGCAGGVVGNAKRVISVGNCVVASERISGQGSGSGNGLSSPFVGSDGGIFPTAISGSKNYYNKDMLIGARKGLAPANVSTIQGEAKSIAELTAGQTLYTNIGFQAGTAWSWSRNANNGFPYLRSAGVLGPEKPYGSKDDPIEIATKADFQKIYDSVNSKTAADIELYGAQYLKQTANINLAGLGEGADTKLYNVIGKVGSSYTGIIGTAFANSFRGNYDGGNHRLQGINIESTVNNTALFGWVVNATFKNIILDKAESYCNTTTARNYAGILVAESSGNLYMENCAIIGGKLTAKTVQGVGALCGYTNQCGGNYFTKCFSSASVDGGYRVGGLVGYGIGVEMSQCYNTGSVASSQAKGGGAGGLIGDLAHHNTATSIMYEFDMDNVSKDTGSGVVTGSTIKDSYAKCDVALIQTYSGNVSAGGIVGLAFGNDTVENCYFFGNITAQQRGGSATGAYGAYAGGMVGLSTHVSVNIKNCLSIINKINESSAVGTYFQTSYFNTYTTVSKVKNVPANPENCYYAVVAFPTLKDASGACGSLNNGTEVTIAKEDGDKLAVTDGSVFTALKWDMTGIWEFNAGINDGFPMLRGLIVDTTELIDKLNEYAVKYSEDMFSAETWANFQNALDDANEAINKNTVTETSKKTLLDALIAAEKNLRADTTTLQEYYNSVIKEIAPSKQYYTNYSLVETYLGLSEELLTRVKNGDATIHNDDINTMYDALKLAVENLRVDKAALNNAIEKANAIILKADAYSPEDITALNSALTEAVEINNKVDASAYQVISATEKLNAALDKMKLDKSKLVEAIIEAYGYIGVKATYDETANKFTLDETNRLSQAKLDNYAAFEKALDSNLNSSSAIKIMLNENATAKQITNAVFNLSVALNDLALNKKDIQELISKADGLLLNETAYQSASVTALKTARAAAGDEIVKTVSKDKLIEMSAALDTVTANLKAAIDGLVFDKTELQTLIGQADHELTVNRDVYTDETAAALQTARDAGQKVYEKTDATQKEISDAVSNIDTAIKNLSINLQSLKKLIDQAEAILSNDNSSLYKNLANLTTRKTEAESVYENCKNGTNNDEEKISSVKNATRQLKAAIDGLEVNNDELENYLRIALRSTEKDYITTVDYTEASVEPFRQLAQKVQDDKSNLTPETTVTYTLQLRALYNALKPNKDKLVAEVAEVSTMSNTKYRQDNDGNWILDENNNMKVFVIYKESTWEALMDELEKANEIILKQDATVKEVNDALAAIGAKKDALIVDTTELEDRIEKAKGLIEKTSVYTQESINALQSQYESAIAFLATASETNLLKLEDVQSHYDALVAAINGLKADISGLQTLIDDANNLIKNYGKYYTDSSANSLKAQVKQAESALGKELDSGSVLHLIETISDAIAKLEIKTAELRDLIGQFNKLDGEFVKNYAAMRSAADDAKALLKTEFTVQQYDTVFTALKSRLDALAPDMTAFKNFIDKCDNEVKNSSASDVLLDPIRAQIDLARELHDHGVSDGDGGYTPADYDDVIASVHALKDALNALHHNSLDLLIKTIQDEMATAQPDFGEGVKTSDCYTEKTYSALQSALEDGTAIAADALAPLEDVDAITAEINSAYKALVLDTKYLKYLIKECEQYKAEYFEEASFTAFTAQLNESKADADNAELTLEEYAISYKALNEAKNALVFATDVLEDLIAIAKTKVQADHSVASFRTLTAKLKVAEDYLAAPEPEKYNDVCSELLEAITKLVYIADLAPAIPPVKEFVDGGNDIGKGVYYSDGSFNAVVNLVEHAIALTASENPTQIDVDNTVNKLNNYLTLLNDVTDFKKFSIAENKYISKYPDRYTHETWELYVKTVEAFDKLLAKADATSAALTKAKQAVEEAKDELVEVPGYVEVLLFELIETNKTFRFIYDDSSAVDFASHEYDAKKPIYLTNIALGDSIADILKQFSNDDIGVYDTNGVEITDLTRRIATGMVLKIFSGDEVVDSITLVVRGDINGDGVIATVDKAQLNAYTNGSNPLTGAFKLACDVNGDGVIATVDKAQLNAYTNGTNPIFDGLSVKGA